MNSQHKPHSPLAIANYLVNKAVKDGRSMSVLKLIKLVYLAHGWCLGHTGKPLINAEVQAWKYGPVIPEIYREFRPHGVHDIDHLAADKNGETYEAEMTEKEQHIVDVVYDVYMPLTAFQVSDLTHQRGTPWAAHRGDFYSPIPEKSIREYYKSLIEEKRNGGG